MFNRLVLGLELELLFCVLFSFYIPTSSLVILVNFGSVISIEN
jgi:hypothetical protein